MVIVEHDDFDSVKNIFKRINERGRKLSRFDKINANLWGVGFNLRRKIEEDINSETRETFGFGNVKGDMVTQALSLNIKGSCRTRTQKNLDSEEVDNEWENTKERILLATRYLSNSLGVKQRDFLPYAGILPVLAYYFRKTDNDTITGHHKDVIDRWFWRVGVSGYYTKKTQNLMTKDSQLIEDLIETGSSELYEQVNTDLTETELKDKLIDTNVKRSTAFRNLFLCILAKQEPRHFKNNEPINLTGKYYSN
ncbi:hypothetical protein AKJ64_04770 [candidate division MSBL1 archaeon SCGC-AAA259E17]|uniref:Uncharacterized protein n=1 Tax=candidate division MSBL1 archaeon SCGC-AAA259E17 TaxID=1698263 RepID=A0A133UAZ1_9EURY|nr:hypothetical protein AKJ64_04770 [candidate division MSBL1 archaeon SCGC-AAA259E17]